MAPTTYTYPQATADVAAGILPGPVALALIQENEPQLPGFGVRVDSITDRVFTAQHQARQQLRQALRRHRPLCAWCGVGPTPEMGAPQQLDIGTGFEWWHSSCSTTAQALQAEADQQAATDATVCLGHTSLGGPAGHVEYCDGTCRPPSCSNCGQAATPADVAHGAIDCAPGHGCRVDIG